MNERRNFLRALVGSAFATPAIARIIANGKQAEPQKRPPETTQIVTMCLDGKPVRMHMNVAAITL